MKYDLSSIRLTTLFVPCEVPRAFTAKQEKKSARLPSEATIGVISERELLVSKLLNKLLKGLFAYTGVGVARTVAPNNCKRFGTS